MHAPLAAIVWMSLLMTPAAQDARPLINSGVYSLAETSANIYDIARETPEADLVEQAAWLFENDPRFGKDTLGRQNLARAIAVIPHSGAGVLLADPGTIDLFSAYYEDLNASTQLTIANALSVVDTRIYPQTATLAKRLVETSSDARIVATALRAYGKSNGPADGASDLWLRQFVEHPERANPAAWHNAQAEDPQPELPRKNSLGNTRSNIRAAAASALLISSPNLEDNLRWVQTLDAPAHAAGWTLLPLLMEKGGICRFEPQTRMLILETIGTLMDKPDSIPEENGGILLGLWMTANSCGRGCDDDACADAAWRLFARLQTLLTNPEEAEYIRRCLREVGREDLIQKN